MIIPALLNKTVEEFTTQVEQLSPYHTHFQVDIADGKFVPNTTISLADLVPYFASKNRNVFDFHLMVEDWKVSLKQVMTFTNNVTVDAVLVHFGAIKDPAEFLTWKKKVNFPLGLVLNPEDSVEDLVKQYSLSDIPAIQIMSVNPGFQGAPFLPATLQKVEQLRNHNYRLKVYLDGSVNGHTIPEIVSQKFPPDILCIGSYLTKAENLVQREKELAHLLTEKREK
ncbi:hypothetical protein HGB07_00595 [Candidatus Roizmanbacteria bacterium]|nr:hypothetical protein [Candidatus Roizmanbacteria bacterium]